MNIVIVYHSDKGHTQVLAQEIAGGIEMAVGKAPRLIAVENIADHWDSLQQADTIVFGSPTYMGSVSGAFKSFMDASSGIWFQRGWANKLAAGFTNSGSLSGDKQGTLQALSCFAAQHGMLWVGQEQICAEFKPDENTINRLGSYLGLMAQCNPYAPAEESPPKGDRATAKLFGQRIGQASLRWKHGVEAA